MLFSFWGVCWLLLGAAYKAWRNCFLHLKIGSETDLGRECHTFEMTKKCTVEPAKKKQKEKRGLVRKRFRFSLQETCGGFFRRVEAHSNAFGQRLSSVHSANVYEHRLPWDQALCWVLGSQRSKVSGSVPGLHLQVAGSVIPHKGILRR